jgi:hypothetical protein
LSEVAERTESAPDPEVSLYGAETTVADMGELLKELDAASNGLQAALTLLELVAAAPGLTVRRREPIPKRAAAFVKPGRSPDQAAPQKPEEEY